MMNMLLHILTILLCIQTQFDSSSSFRTDFLLRTLRQATRKDCSRCENRLKELICKLSDARICLSNEDSRRIFTKRAGSGLEHCVSLSGCNNNPQCVIEKCGYTLFRK